MSDTEEEVRIDALRIRALETNSVADRLNYFGAVSSWFQGRHERRMDTRTGLTDAQREAVGRFRIEPDDAGCAYCQDGASWMVVSPDGIALSKSWHDKEEAEWTVEQLNGALSLGLSSSTPTPPEPPKPERKVVQVGWLHTTCHEDAVAELCVQGWEPYQALTIPETLELLYFLKRPIPGDAA